MFPKRLVYREDAPVVHSVGAKAKEKSLYITDIAGKDLPSFRTAVLNTITSKHPLHHRINALLQYSPSFYWSSNNHKKRFECFSRWYPVYPHYDNPIYRAVVYLLTSNVELYKRTKGCFSLDGIDLRKANTCGISSQNYVLLAVASDMYDATRKVEVADLADRSAVNNETFSLVVNSLLISLYGVEITKECRRDMQYDY